MFVEKIDTTIEVPFGDSIAENHKEFIEYDYWDEKKPIDYKYEYNINDCCLVRTTNALPVNGVIETPEHGFAVEYDVPYGFEFDFSRYCRDNNIDVNLFKIPIRSRRDTVHFCINGLVGNHMLGNFSGRSFFILEPLKYHAASPDLLSLRTEDTYFESDIELSNEAAIIIKDEVYQSIKDNPEYASELQRYRIFTFVGDNEVLAVNTVLNRLGYDAFIVNDHGYLDGLKEKTPAGKMWKFINNFAKSNNIGQDPHFESANRFKVVSKMFTESQEITVKIAGEMLTELNREDEIGYANYLINSANDYSDELEEYLCNLAISYGLDRFHALTSRIGEEILSQIEDEKSSKTL